MIVIKSKTILLVITYRFNFIVVCTQDTNIYKLGYHNCIIIMMIIVGTPYQILTPNRYEEGVSIPHPLNFIVSSLPHLKDYNMLSKIHV